jgi:hypothetical protein
MEILFFTFHTPPVMAQSAKQYHNVSIENSDNYQNGNLYQKDFLLFIEMLHSTHPSFVSPLSKTIDIDSLREAGYADLANVNSMEKFKNYLTAVASLLEDGHTYVQNFFDPQGLLYLFQIKIDYPNVFLVVIPEEHKESLGKQIVMINNHPVWEVINSFSGSFSYDNEISRYERVGQYMQWYSIWEDNPFITKDSTLTFSFSDETTLTLTPEKLSKKRKSELVVVKKGTPKSNAITLFQNKPFLYSILENEKICYLQFNKCEDLSTILWDKYSANQQITKEDMQKLEGNYQRFDAFIEKMFKEMKAKSINTLVVDLRYNGGGNSMLCNVLLSYLKPIQSIQTGNTYIRVSPFAKEHYPVSFEDFETTLIKEKKVNLEMGKLYFAKDLSPQNNKPTAFEKKTKDLFKMNKNVSNVFTGDIFFLQSKKTYSSAALLILNAVDNHIGKVIGEKSSYKPCNYGDILAWELPNTQIQGGISYKIFRRTDETKCNQNFITPDVLIEEHWDDILQGNGDKCWEWIMINSETNNKK